jgi:hypothetical protein
MIKEVKINKMNEVQNREIFRKFRMMLEEVHQNILSKIDKIDKERGDIRRSRCVLRILQRVYLNRDTPVVV